MFSIAIVMRTAGDILDQTSQRLAHPDPRQHVAADLAVFSSVALRHPHLPPDAAIAAPRRWQVGANRHMLYG